ncbi:MAG: hypothetical protein ACE5EI_08625 [Thermodesulfobacteriota bacterium]
MYHYILNESDRKKMAPYPALIDGPYKSECCNSDTVLKQYAEGGFVKAFCFKCGKDSSLLSKEKFFALDFFVRCPKCERRMEEFITPHKNYAYKCESCQIYVWLADLLPDGQRGG